MESIYQIIHNQEIIAIIIKSNFSDKGIHFFTPQEFPQQLAYMAHPQGTMVSAHIHNKIERKIYDTQEVLLIKSGKVKVDIFDSNKKYLESHILTSGDIILFAMGGHGLEMIENSEIIEVKQGPYLGTEDKVRI